MNYTTAAISYALLLIPAALAVTVISQGLTKLKKKEPMAPLIIGLGVVLLLIIPVGYFLLIHV